MASLILTWTRRFLILKISLIRFSQLKTILFFTQNNEKVSHFIPISEEEKAQKDLLLSVAFKNGRYWLMPVSYLLLL